MNLLDLIDFSFINMLCTVLFILAIFGILGYIWTNFPAILIIAGIGIVLKIIINWNKDGS